VTTQRFAYRLGSRSWPVLRLFGVGGPADAWVDLDDETLTAKFGWATATTPVANIASWRIEGPWRWITAIGIRRSLRHADLTFGGSPHGGVRLDFREPITVVRLPTPALYLTVDDLDRLAAALAARGIPGVDVRRATSR
jgi:hypothetical protein